MSRPKRVEDCETDLRLSRLDDLHTVWLRGLPASTIEAAEEYHRRYPALWRTCFQLGDALLDACRLTDAIAALTKALGHAPKDWRRAQTAERIGKVHHARGDMAIAEEWQRRAVATCPESARYLTGLAGILEKGGRREEALTVLEEAVQRVGDEQGMALCQLGLMRRRQRRYAEAEAHLNAALEVDPDLEDARSALRDVEEVGRCADVDIGERVSRAEGLGPSDHPAACLELILPVLAEDPLDVDACLLHCQALESLGLLPEAVAAFEVVRRLGFGALVELSIGELYQDMGLYDAAEKAYLRARQARPGDADPLNFLAAMWRARGRLDEAESAAREGTESEEGCIDEAFRFLGLVLVGKRRYPEALECFERAVELDPDYDLAKACVEDMEELSRTFPRLMEAPPEASGEPRDPRQ